MEELLRLLDKEQAVGYTDSAVFGGLGAYLSAWAAEQSLPELALLAQSYQQASLALRPELLRQISAALAMVKAPALVAKKPAPALAAPNPATLSLPLTTLASVGEKRAQTFARLGLKTIGDLLAFYPRDYRDRRSVTPISQAPVNSLVQVRGEIVGSESVRTNSGLPILTCLIRDDSGVLALIWFNQPFLQKKLTQGREILAYGKVEKRYGKISLTVQDYQLTDEENAPGPGILPIYDGTAGLSQKMIRAAVTAAWQRGGKQLPELIPEALREKRMLLQRSEAVAAMHFPESFAQLEIARRSLAYAELLAIQLAVARNVVPPAKVVRATDQQDADNEEIYADFAAALPFSPTPAQERVIREIYEDMDRGRAMSRLVQGDVGSGKTAVAAAAIYKCCRREEQAALMAPTEILARQHYQGLLPLLTRLGLTAALLTGHTPAVERRAILSQLETGVLDCLIGTHALIQEGVNFRQLGLAVTDEQHRFGVAQRARLRGQEDTDLLVMTATPIPRTLAMTLYADLSFSVIDQLPPGRKPVRTYAVDYSYEQRIYKFLDQEIAKGRQAFVVCPLVEQSEKTDLDSATELFRNLSAGVFRHRRLALLHGRMKQAEKEAVMDGFYQGEIDILIATTVVEVGVNVPNATMMLIRDAERFGLAQLHQLRGRIGRGGEQSHCILMHNAQSDVAKERMKIISQTSDGFALAEADLQQRGPGEIFGQRQHGLPELKVANLFRDAELLNLAQQDAAQLHSGHIKTTPALEAEVGKLTALLV